MYKDKDKQKEANRVAQARFKAKGITEGITNQGITLTSPVIPDGSTTIDAVQALHRLIAKPLVIKARRGKDITNFEHLPPDVQGTIIRLTTNQDGTVDEQARTNRTAIAIDYQHKTGRYESHSIGTVPVSNPIPVKVSKPGDADYKPLCEYTRQLY